MCLVSPQLLVGDAQAHRHAHTMPAIDNRLTGQSFSHTSTRLVLHLVGLSPSIPSQVRTYTRNSALACAIHRQPATTNEFANTDKLASVTELVVLAGRRQTECRLPRRWRDD
jgi:hypothetical protein